MNNKKKYSAYNTVAKKHQTTPDAVRNEIIAAMKMAMSSTDPSVQQKWASIPKAGDEPTPEELIDYIITELKKTKSS